MNAKVIRSEAKKIGLANTLPKNAGIDALRTAFWAAILDNRLATTEFFQWNKYYQFKGASFSTKRPAELACRDSLLGEKWRAHGVSRSPRRGEEVKEKSVDREREKGIRKRKAKSTVPSWRNMEEAINSKKRRREASQPPATRKVISPKNTIPISREKEKGREKRPVELKTTSTLKKNSQAQSKRGLALSTTGSQPKKGLAALAVGTRTPLSPIFGPPISGGRGIPLYSYQSHVPMTPTHPGTPSMPMGLTPMVQPPFVAGLDGQDPMGLYLQVAKERARSNLAPGTASRTHLCKDR
jgi:hypothetical protein